MPDEAAQQRDDGNGSGMQGSLLVFDRVKPPVLKFSLAVFLLGLFFLLLWRPNQPVYTLVGLLFLAGVVLLGGGLLYLREWQMKSRLEDRGRVILEYNRLRRRIQTEAAQPADLPARPDARPLPSAPEVLSAGPSFPSVTLDQYLGLSPQEQEAMQLRAYEGNREWIDRELSEHSAEWLLVVRAQVQRASSSLGDYPSGEDLEDLAREHGEIPYVFVRTPLIEETAWSRVAADDLYPTVAVCVGSASWEESVLPTSGLQLTADFDTGSPHTFVDGDQLEATGLFSPSSLSTQVRRHLDRSYTFFVAPLLVGVRDESGQFEARGLSCLCVRNWRNSPLCLVNPNRQALAGRNLFGAFGFTLELDASRQATRLRLPS